jgi:hypothetical protein
VRPVRPLLPDLSYGTPVTVTFDTPSFPLFEPEPPPGASCFESEVLEDGAQNCLRFASRGRVRERKAFRSRTGSGITGYSRDGSWR